MGSCLALGMVPWYPNQGRSALEGPQGGLAGVYHAAKNDLASMFCAPPYPGQTPSTRGFLGFLWLPGAKVQQGFYSPKIA